MAIKPIIDPIATAGKSLLLVDLKPAYERVKNSSGEFEKTDKITHYNYNVLMIGFYFLILMKFQMKLM